MADDDNGYDSIAAIVQIALFTVYASDGRIYCWITSIWTSYDVIFKSYASLTTCTMGDVPLALMADWLHRFNMLQQVCNTSSTLRHNAACCGEKDATCCPAVWTPLKTEHRYDVIFRLSICMLGFVPWYFSVVSIRSEYWGPNLVQMCNERNKRQE